MNRNEKLTLYLSRNLVGILVGATSSAIKWIPAFFGWRGGKPLSQWGAMKIRQQLPLRLGGPTGQACRTPLKKYGTSIPYLTRLTIAAINARFKPADLTCRVMSCLRP